MVPNKINAMPNLVASLQGGGGCTALSAEKFGFAFTLFQYQPK